MLHSSAFCEWKGQQTKTDNENGFHFQIYTILSALLLTVSFCL